ncbi:unnamed protein product, partial [Vitis vinifera]
MEGEILNHIWQLSSLEKLSLDRNHFSSLPAGISQLSNLKGLKLSHCKNLLQIPELPSSVQFLDAHWSDGISSRPSVPPIRSLINCFKSELIPYVQINSTENRPAFHVALHAPKDVIILRDGKNMVPNVYKVLDKIGVFFETVCNGSLVGGQLEKH